MKITVDVDLSAAPAANLFESLTPEDWRAIAREVALRVYSDPAGECGAVESEMRAEAARGGPIPWLRDWQSRGAWAGDKAHSPEWAHERARRMALRPAGAAVLAIDRLVSQHVRERVEAMFGDDTRLSALTRDAVAAVDLDSIVQRGIRAAFRDHIADAMREDRES